MSPGRRYYAFLLRFLPSDFRASRGSELLATFDDMRGELGPRPGVVRLGGFYLRLTVDLLGVIPLASSAGWGPATRWTAFSVTFVWPFAPWRGAPSSSWWPRCP